MKDFQKEYKKLIPKGKGYDHRGLHISVSCGCGFKYSTPYWIKDNARCRECGKRITTFQKVKDLE